MKINKINYLKFISVTLILIFIVLLSIFKLKEPKYEYFHSSGFYFDTIIDIGIYDTNKAHAEAVLSECIDLCKKYDNLYSVSQENSDIYLINNSNEKKISVSPETIDIINNAIYYSELSENLVSPLVYPLTALWDASENNNSLPNDDILKEALTHVNTNIIIENNIIKLEDPKGGLNLGFIAKGYIADKLKEYLRNQGIESGIINLGGNVLCLGSKPDGNEYTVGLRDPFNPDSQTPILTIHTKDKSVVSSGDYERFYVINEEKYNHILSTKNGYPVCSDLKQVTIISEKSTDGDALSTICFILGYEDGIKFLEKNFPETSAVFVDAQGNIKCFNYDTIIQQ